MFQLKPERAFRILLSDAGSSLHNTAVAQCSSMGHISCTTARAEPWAMKSWSIALRRDTPTSIVSGLRTRRFLHVRLNAA